MSLHPLSVDPTRVLPKIPHGTVNAVGEVYGCCEGCRQVRWLRGGLCGCCRSRIERLNNRRQR